MVAELNSGSSFGNLTAATQTHNSDTRKSDAVGAIPDSIIDLLPRETCDVFRKWQFKVQFYAGVISDDLKDSAQKLILTGAMNDALGLSRQIDRSEGRASAFTARVLFEHAINFYDVTQSAVNTSDRFLAHDWVTAEQLGNRRWHLEYLDSRERKRQSNFLEGLSSRTKRFFRDAPGEYSEGGFKRGWTKGTNLKERAATYGFEDYYEGYKILSGVVHGSSGGLRGLVLQRQGGEIHRLGPDLDLLLLAYQEGLRFFEIFLQGLEQVSTGPEVEEILGLTRDLLDRMRDVQNLIKDVDKAVSPTDIPPQTRIAFVALYASGKKRWYLHDTRLGLTCVSGPPAWEPDLAEMWHLAAGSTDWEAGLPHVVAVPEVRLSASDDAWWVEHHKIFPHLLDRR